MSGAPPLERARVLVTGGAGFIGSHLVDALVAEEAEVRVLDNLATGSSDNLGASADAIELVEGDLRRAEDCRRACSGVRYVFHLAALGSVPRSLEQPATSLEVNAQGTANLFAAARAAGVERLVYASSSSVYGDSPSLPRREGEEGRPLSPYALSKQIGEQVAATFHRCYGLASLGLRYFNVYGPRQHPDGPYAAVIPRFFKARLAGSAPTVYGDGEQSRDFTYVADAVTATLLAAGAAEADGLACNVASGRRTTINELDRLVADITGHDAPPDHAPQRPGDVRHSHADLSLATRLLGYAPAVELSEGLAATLRYYRRHFAPATVEPSRFRQSPS